LEARKVNFDIGRDISMQIFNVLLNVEPDKSCYAGNEAIVQDVSGCQLKNFVCAGKEQLRRATNGRSRSNLIISNRRHQWSCKRFEERRYL
jgi:hypothetical protein